MLSSRQVAGRIGIGQVWSHRREGRLVVVLMPHRKDRSATVLDSEGNRWELPFYVLGRSYERAG